MKIAVVALTKKGAIMADRVRAAFSGLPEADVHVYVPAKFAAGYPGALPYMPPLADLCGRLFREYAALVMVMALGIVFRVLAPHLKDKKKDPAVVVVDEMGRFAISALSGHLGGANDLAGYLGEKLDCTGVVTTATDTHGLPAVDLLARDYGLVIEPVEMVREVNAALVNGESVHFYSELELEGEMPSRFDIKPLNEYPQSEHSGEPAVFITNRIMTTKFEKVLFLRPRNLAVGLGCRRGVTAGDVRRAIAGALAIAGRSVGSLKVMATVDRRKNEDGIRQAAGDMCLPLKYFTVDEIASVFSAHRGEVSSSQYVFQKIGVGGVCEPAALLAAPAAKLILPKTVLNGITVAVAEENLPLSERARVNRVI